MEVSTFSAAIILMVAVLLVGCTSVERSAQHVPNQTLYPNETININIADKDELQRIPYIGERLADDIIQYREKHGPFRRAEHLMLLNGISDRRFREIRRLVRVD